MEQSVKGQRIVNLTTENINDVFNWNSYFSLPLSQKLDYIPAVAITSAYIDLYLPSLPATFPPEGEFDTILEQYQYMQKLELQVNLTVDFFYSYDTNWIKYNSRKFANYGRPYLVDIFDPYFRGKNFYEPNLRLGMQIYFSSLNYEFTENDRAVLSIQFEGSVSYNQTEKLQLL